MHRSSWAAYPHVVYPSQRQGENGRAVRHARCGLQKGSIASLQWVLARYFRTSTWSLRHTYRFAPIGIPPRTVRIRHDYRIRRSLPGICGHHRYPDAVVHVASVRGLRVQPQDGGSPSDSNFLRRDVWHLLELAKSPRQRSRKDNNACLQLTST